MDHQDIIEAENERVNYTPSQSPSWGLMLLGLIQIVTGLYYIGYSLRCALRYRQGIISSNMSFADASLRIPNMFISGTTSFLLVAGLIGIAVGVELIRRRSWSRTFLIYSMTFNLFTPLYTYAWFGPQRILADGIVVSFFPYIAAPLIWWFLLRDKTKIQFPKRESFRLNSVFGICIVLFTIYMLTPLAAIVVYKRHLEQKYNFPFAPLKAGIIQTQNETDSELPADYIMVQAFNLRFPAFEDLHIAKFFNPDQSRLPEQGTLSGTMLLRSNRTGSRNAILISQKSVIDQPSLLKIHGCPDSYSFMKTIYTANWSLIPLILKQLIHIKNGEPFINENENRKIVGMFALPHSSRKKSVADMLIYSPEEKVTRSLTMIFSSSSMDKEMMMALTQMIRFEQEIPQHAGNHNGILGELEALEMYRKDPTMDHAILLTERLLQNDVTDRKHILHLLNNALSKDPDNIKGQELLASIQAEIKENVQDE